MKSFLAGVFLFAAMGSHAVTVETHGAFDIHYCDAAGMGWNFGSAAPAANEIDFRSVITHEIGHSLGFRSDSNRSVYAQPHPYCGNLRWCDCVFQPRKEGGLI